jgi:hypothetical protein
MWFEPEHKEQARELYVTLREEITQRHPGVAFLALMGCLGDIMDSTHTKKEFIDAVVSGLNMKLEQHQ